MSIYSLFVQPVAYYFFDCRVQSPLECLTLLAGGEHIVFWASQTVSRLGYAYLIGSVQNLAIDSGGGTNGFPPTSSRTDNRLYRRCNATPFHSVIDVSSFNLPFLRDRSLFRHSPRAYQYSNLTLMCRLE